MAGRSRSIDSRRTSLGGRPSPQRILVMGGGFLGCHIARSLEAIGVRVSVLTRSRPTDPFRAALVAKAELTIADVAACDLKRHLNGVDHVVYALGCQYPAEAASDPIGAATQTLQPLLATLEALRSRPEASITFISSGGTVYGNAASFPIPETAPTQPLSEYGVLKLASEEYVRLYGRRYGTRTQVVRAANPYGPGQEAGRGQGVIAAFLDAAAKGTGVDLYGSPQYVRDFIYVQDLADGIAQMCMVGSSHEVVNVGSGVGHSLSEVLELVRRVTGRPLPATELPARSFDVSANVLDSSRFAAQTSVTPRSLEAGLVSAWTHVDSMRALPGPPLLPELDPPQPAGSPGRPAGSANGIPVSIR